MPRTNILITTFVISFFLFCKGFNAYAQDAKIEESMQNDSLLLIQEQVQEDFGSNDSTRNLPQLSKDTLTSHNSLQTRIETFFNDSIFDGLNQECINFYLNTAVNYVYISQFKDQSALKEYVEGWRIQIKIEELNLMADSLRKVYEFLVTEEEQQTIAQELLSMESQLMDLSSKPAEHFEAARSLELAQWGKPTSKEIQTLSKENKEIPKILEQLINQKKNKIEPILDNSKTNDSIAVEEFIPEDIAIEESEEQAAFPEEELSSGIIYKVQIGTFNKTVPLQTQKKFDRLAVLRKIDKIQDEKGTLIYSIGELRDFKDAVNLQNQIRQEGIKDAFVVAYLDGKRIPLSEAKKIAQ